MKDAFNYYYDLAYSQSEHDKIVLTVIFGIVMVVLFIIGLIKER